MSSVKFEGGQCKGNAQASNVLRHSDPTQENRARVREAKEKKGEICHIDPEKSHLNYSIHTDGTTGKKTYSEAFKRYKSRLMDIEASPLCTNHRKDRTTMINLEIPAPPELQGEEKREARQKWAIRVFQILAGIYGEKNVVYCVVHEDETHEYTDAKTGEKVFSREHIHFSFIPEHEGQLTGHWAMQRGRIQKCNREIENMTVTEFNCHFHTGAKTRSRETVQELKAKSQQLEEAQKAREELQEARQKVDALEAKSRELLQEITAMREAKDKAEEEADELEAHLRALTGELEHLEELREKYPNDIEEAKKGVLNAQKEYEQARQLYIDKLDQLKGKDMLQAFFTYEDGKHDVNGANFGAFLRREFREFQNFTETEHANITRQHEEAEKRARETAETLEQLPDRKKELQAKRERMKEQQRAFFDRIKAGRQQAQDERQKQ